MSNPLISLCIPTNGVVEWVFNTLDSIYQGAVSEELFEVVVTNNGNNEEFHQKMLTYAQKHSNIVYEKTDAPLFLNEIESYKRASGEFIKFLNHRSLLLPDTLQAFVAFVQENIDEKPVIYFTNGFLKGEKIAFACDSFDTFVEKLSYWSSCSTGMGFWKQDFESIPVGTTFNELFPHTTILFWERNRNKYIVDNRVLLGEQPTGSIPKGRYDLFHAFAVEYPAILCDLVRDGSISTQTFLQVKEDNLSFIAEQYIIFVIHKSPCSYDLSSFDSSIQVFYSRKQISSALHDLRWGAIKDKFKRLVKKNTAQ